MLYLSVAQFKLDPSWVKRAVVRINWTWLGEDFGLVNVGEVETEDPQAVVTVKNTQPPMRAH
jgi:hypothetical protein